MTEKKALELIKEYGLKPSIRREISLFGSSCIAVGYTKYLKSHLGFACDAYGAVGNKGGLLSLINEKEIAVKVEKFIKKNISLINETLDKAIEVFKDSKARIEAAEKTCQKIHTRFYGK